MVKGRSIDILKLCFCCEREWLKTLAGDGFLFLGRE